ncbi:MAG: HAD-IA family hydrolase [Chloroflexota bacterium]|nr:HAD-IA family hydrolase [Chloroflexota bacterium]
MTRIDAVLFDWGDTLFESPHAPSMILEAARESGIPMDAAAAEHLWTDIWAASKTAQEHAKGRDLSTDAHRRVWTDLFERARTNVPGIERVLYERVMKPSSWRPYVDAEPTLRTLRDRGLKIGIVSNHPYDLRPFLAEHGLAGYIDAYVLSGEVGAAKPSPEMFTEASRMLGVAPEHALMVGDDAVSDGGAAAVGFQFYLLPDYEHGTARGLDEVVHIVDRSRA